MPYSDPEKQRAYQRRWARRKAASNRAGLLERRRRWREKNRDRINAYNAKWKGQNPEKVRAWLRGWRRRNRNEVNRKARERYQRVGGKVPRRLLPELIEAQAGLCGICGEVLPSRITAEIHVDHIIPVSAGGSNERENLQAAHAVCNMRKNDSVPLTATEGL